MTQESNKKKASEEVRIRLEKARLKGLETRRMKAELKKQSKQEEKEALRQAYEDKVLKKKPTTKPKEVVADKNEEIEETDRELYPRKHNTDDECESETESIDEPIVTVKQKTKKQPKQPKQPKANTEPNYKNEYYRMKMMKMQQQDEQQQFQQSYARASPQTHMVDIAKSQLKSKIDNEVYTRVFKDLFGQ